MHKGRKKTWLENMKYYEICWALALIIKAALAYNKRISYSFMTYYFMFP